MKESYFMIKKYIFMCILHSPLQMSYLKRSYIHTVYSYFICIYIVKFLSNTEMNILLKQNRSCVGIQVT